MFATKIYTGAIGVGIRESLWKKDSDFDKTVFAPIQDYMAKQIAFIKLLGNEKNR